MKNRQKKKRTRKLPSADETWIWKMSSRDSGQWCHLSKLRRNLSECTTFSRPESTYWNNVTVMLFFHKIWLFQKKKFPNRCTVLASAWSDRCGVTSRRFWPAVYWKKSDPMFFFRARIIHVNVQCLPSTEFITPKNYGFFFSNDYYLAL